MKILESFLTKWTEQGVELFSGASSAEIISVFGQLGSAVTPDILTLYSRVGGMSDMDDNMWRLWSLSEVLERNNSKSNYGIMFADYLMDSCCYRLKPNGEFSCVYVDYFSDEVMPMKIAHSLEQFFISYSMNSDFIIK